MDTIREKIAQMNIVGIKNKADIPFVKKLITDEHIGGVIIYKNNYSNYSDMIKLINSLKECNKNNKYPLFVAIDQEGGIVNRLPKEFHNISGADEFGALKDVSLIKEAGLITGNILNRTGINMNFAPVMDLNNFSKNGVIENRTFSDDPEIVSMCGIAYMNGLADSNIISVIKHYPGHGASTIDSHKFLPIVFNYDKVKEKHLYPFKQAIKNNVDAIMVGHIAISSKKFMPASISKTVIDELKDEFNYKNLIITDELSMRGLRYLYGRKRVIKRAFLAGNDIICNKYFSEYTKCNIDNIVLLVNDGKIDSTTIDNSFNKIIRIKKKYQLSDDKSDEIIDIDKINNQIDKLNKKITDYDK